MIKVKQISKKFPRFPKDDDVCQPAVPPPAIESSWVARAAACRGYWGHQARPEQSSLILSLATSMTTVLAVKTNCYHRNLQKGLLAVQATSCTVQHL